MYSIYLSSLTDISAHIATFVVHHHQKLQNKVGGGVFLLYRCFLLDYLLTPKQWISFFPHPINFPPPWEVGSFIYLFIYVQLLSLFFFITRWFFRKTFSNALKDLSFQFLSLHNLSSMYFWQFSRRDIGFCSLRLHRRFFLLWWDIIYIFIVCIYIIFYEIKHLYVCKCMQE